MELTGQIPDFIGDWTKLTTLRILGTGLSGPIPASFSNLTSLTELYVLHCCHNHYRFTVALPFLFSTYSYTICRRLGDISNGNSSLEFIKDMKSLSILVLRNNNLTGTIPSNIGEYSSLRQLYVYMSICFFKCSSSFFRGFLFVKRVR
jgi:hypothetical protein